MKTKYLYVLQKVNNYGVKQTKICWHPIYGWHVVKKFVYQYKKNYQKLPKELIYIGEYD